MTQRDDDTGQVEAKVKAQKLFDEWSAAYQGKRAGAQDGSRPGRGGIPEDSQAADADNSESFGVGAEGAPVLPAAGY